MSGEIGVLVIEDNPGDARLIRELMEESGPGRFKIRVATDFKQGLAALAEARYDIALLDLSLPDSSGLSGLLRLRAEYPELPIVIMTGFNDEELAVQATRAGAQDYLIKGESPSHALARSVRYAIERKLSERELERSEAIYRTLFAGNPLPMVLFEETTLRMLEVNDAMTAEYGYARNELLSMTLLDLRPPEDAEAFRRSVREDAQSLQPRVWSQRKKSGELVQVEVTMGRRDFGGRPARVGLMRDVTAQREAQRQLAESEHKFRLMTENIHQVFWMTNPEKNRMLYVSPAYEAIWGRTCESLYRSPMTWLEAILPEDRAGTADALAKQVDGSYDVMYRIQRPDGSLRWIRDRAFPVRDETGQVIHVTGVAEDVTGQVKAAEALRESQGLLEQAEGVAHVGSWSSPVDGSGPLIWSKECFRIFGLPVGAPPCFTEYLAMVHPDDRGRVSAAREEAIRDGTRYSVEYRFLRGDGATRYLSARADVVCDLKGRVERLVGVVQDVTERIESEIRLKEAETQLLQTHKMEAVGRLAGGVAHDFNNLLTVILGTSEMAIASLPKDHAVRADIEEIHRTGLRAAALTQQLLAFSRRQVIAPRRHDLNASVAGMSKLLRRVIGEQIELSVKTHVVPVVAMVDPGQIEQLIMNLAVNGRDAMPEGGKLVIEASVVALDAENARLHDGLPPGEYATLSVCDTGSGISDEVKGRLFEPFFTTKELGKGTGLGLATCYGIAKQNKGGIVCHSVVGRGTTFVVLVPFLREPSVAVLNEASTEAPSQGAETLLLIEDEESIRKVSVRVLTAQGYATLEAADGEAGLSILRQDAQRHIRLALIDMVMPKLGGDKLAKAVAEIRPDVRILFMTGHTDEALSGRTLAHDVLRKPFTSQELCGKIRAVLDA
jgi:PAS domain S-box-containing protein